MLQDVNVEGVVTGLIVAGICWAIAKGVSAYRLWDIATDIAFIELERKHLEEIKRSSVAMNRSAFRSVFLMFTLIAVAHVGDAIAGFLAITPIFKVLLNALPWVLVALTGFAYMKRYESVKHYERSILELDGKRVKLEEKKRKLEK